MKDFCGYCGTKFEQTNWKTDWPRTCKECKTESYANPIPVVVVLQPVAYDSSFYGLMIGQRANNPGAGKWALIGGFMDIHETPEEAAKREFREETGLEVESEPRYICSHVTEAHWQLTMFFVIDKAMSPAKYLQGKTCPENLALGVSLPNQTMAFPNQTDVVKRWYAGEFALKEPTDEQQQP